MEISLIGVPINYGCDKEGAQHGPEKLREKGIIDIIKKYNHKIYDFGDVHVPKVCPEKKYEYHEKMKYLKVFVSILYFIVMFVISLSVFMQNMNDPSIGYAAYMGSNYLNPFYLTSFIVGLILIIIFLFFGIKKKSIIVLLDNRLSIPLI